jgi:hypothetical protein
VLFILSILPDLNSMFDFGFYNLHGEMMAAEARGQPSFLRDETGKIIELCNDGNGYCNITTFDWTQKHVRDLWMQAITNATASKNVDGIFADHSAQENIQIGSRANGQKENQLCNGQGSGRKCYNFTAPFKKSFNSWHLWATNQSQDLLSKTTGGPVICGPLARYSVPACDFDALRNAQKKYAVIEANHYHDGVGSTCNPDHNCLAAFLAAAEPHTYLTCFSSTPPSW